MLGIEARKMMAEEELPENIPDDIQILKNRSSHITAFAHLWHSHSGSACFKVREVENPLAFYIQLYIQTIHTYLLSSLDYLFGTGA